MQPDLIAFQRDFAAALDAPATGPMAVYRNTVLQGAVEALRANFPIVAQILGDEMFEAAAVDHASECPPRQPVLALYGARFAEWLQHQPWIDDVPYVPDVARVERLYVESLMAADAQAVTASELGDDPSDLRLALHPALSFAWLSTPAMTIWLAHQGTVPSELAPEWKHEGALFARPRHEIMHTPRMSRSAHRLLSGIRLGETVGQAIAAAARLYPQDHADALFGALVNLGAFIPRSPERNPL
ncbi:DNA-binding domain-containing protein [Sphingomonas flavescens]|uniref:DNA-binding domain-containing protein n=1 Tax=Sphingomonas flavescens TaxID=3132797 RepID=UPI0028056C72|nr:DNA-binding domain-containing protein [Sphingomonas limnosediminicola]